MMKTKANRTPKEGEIAGKCGLCGGITRVSGPTHIRGDVVVILDKKKTIVPNADERVVYWRKCEDCGASG